MNKRRYAIIILLSVVIIGVTTGAYFISTPTEEPTDSTKQVGYWKGVTATDDISTQNGYVSKDDSEEFIYRAIARTEEIRGEPFQQDISVEITTREEHREDNPFQQQAQSYEKWSDTIWSGMLVVPRQESVQEIQTEFANENVLAYYLISQDKLIVVADEETETGYYIDEATLIHELGHALQDQRMGLNRDPINSEVTTIRQTNLSLIEGESSLYEQKFQERCQTEWECVETPLKHRSESYDGTYTGFRQLSVAPYNIGLEYINTEANGNWDELDEIYESNSLYRSRQLHYETENPQEVVKTQDISSNQWSLTTSRGMNGRDILGLHGMAAILTHYNEEYDIEIPYPDQTQSEFQSPYLQTYESDSFAPYTDASNRQGFVWTIRWSSPESAEQFEEIYISAIQSTGGYIVEDPDYSIPEDSVDNHTVLSGGGEFQGAYSITRNESMLTITSAPLVTDLQEIRPTQLEPRIVNEYQTTTLSEPEYEITSVEDRESEEIIAEEDQQQIPESVIIILRILAVIVFVTLYVYIDGKVRD